MLGPSQFVSPTNVADKAFRRMHNKTFDAQGRKSKMGELGPREKNCFKQCEDLWLYSNINILIKKQYLKK